MRANMHRQTSSKTQTITHTRAHTRNLTKNDEMKLRLRFFISFANCEIPRVEFINKHFKNGFFFKYLLF